MGLANKIKSLIPVSIKRYYPIYVENSLIKNAKKRHSVALNAVKEKETITVAFLVIFGALWKYDLLYKLFEDDKRFKPVIVICPYTIYGKDNMMQELDRAYNLFKNKGYRVLSSYEAASDSFIDIKRTIKPDMVFFTNPHFLTLENYYISNFKEVLTCYVQYSFHVSSLNKEQYDQLFHNLLWKAFYETSMHKTFAIKYARNKGINVAVTGYPGTDVFLDKSYQPIDVWKIKSADVKRIIWAPHHTINENDSNLGYSNFLQYADYFLNLLERFKNKLQIAFKPHPILRQKLYLHQDWGKQKTDNYYSQWETLSNAMLFEDDYVDLFCSSDAIIHDSGSFLVEYLFQNKPALFCFRNNDVENKFNDFGKLALKVNSKAFHINDIEKFIQEDVFNGYDSLLAERSEFILKYLIPPHHKTASQNIFDIILKEIKV